MTTTASNVHFASETVKGTLARLAMAIVGFAGTVLFARLLGPTAFGGFYLLFALVKILDRPIGGTAIAAKKRYSEPDPPRREIVGGVVTANAVWTVVVVVVAFLAADWLARYTGLTDAWVLTIVLIVPVALYTSIDELVESKGLLGAANWTDALRSYFTLPAQLLFVLLGYGAAGMVFGLAGATLLALPVLWYHLGTLPSLPTRRTLGSLWSFARYSIPNSFVTQTYDRLDLLLLGVLLFPAAAGQYEVALKLTLPGIFVATVASGGLLGRISNRPGKTSAIATDVTNTLAYSSIFSIPILFGALAIPRQLVITVYGPEYAAAATLLIGLAAFRVVQSQRVPLREAINGLDLPHKGLRLSALTLAFNVVAGIALITRFGAPGVVVATVVAELIYYLVVAYFVKSELPHVSLIPRPLLEQVAAGVLMFIVVHLLDEAVAVRSWLDLAALVGAGAFVYWLVLLSISAGLRATIGSVFRGSRVEHLVPERILQW